jgi:hypothetical protein
MAIYAKQKLGSREWNDSSFMSAAGTANNVNYSVNPNPGSWDKRGMLFSFKCNLFVADIAKLAGTHTWDEIAHAATLNAPVTTREPTASEWANPGFRIKGWMITVSGSVEPGDVASDGHHMGIVSLTRKLISASSREGRINEVDWDNMGRAVKRRFVGVTLEDIEGALPKSSGRPTKRTF